MRTWSAESRSSAAGVSGATGTGVAFSSSARSRGANEIAVQPTVQTVDCTSTAAIVVPAEDRVLGLDRAAVVADPADHGVGVLEHQHAGDLRLQGDVAHALGEHVHVRPAVGQRQHVCGDDRLAQPHRSPPRVPGGIEAGERARQRPPHGRLVDLDLALVDHPAEFRHRPARRAVRPATPAGDRCAGWPAGTAATAGRRAAPA